MKRKAYLSILLLLLITVKVFGQPQGSITANGPFCVTGAGQLTWTASAGTGPYTVVYKENGGADQTAVGVTSGIPFNVATTPVTTTTNYLLVSVTDATPSTRNSGFTGPTATITVNPLPTPSFTAQPGAGPVCAGTDVTYTTQSSKSSYVWGGLGILNTDYTITSGGTSSTDHTVTLKWVTSGSKTVTINYTEGGCTAASPTSSTTTTVNALPTPTFTAQPGAGPVCTGIDVTYTTQSGKSNYVWGGLGTLTTDYTITSGGTSSTDNTVTLKWITSGSKTVTINYTEGGCTAASATSSTTTTVNPLPTPSFTAQPGAGPVCAGTDVTYTTQSSKSSYVWGGLGILNTDYTITSGGTSSTDNTVTLKWITSGSKTVTINYTEGGCTAASATSSTTTTVNPLPTPSFTAQPGAGPICAGADVTYTTQSSKSSYVWGGLGILNTDYTITSGGTSSTDNTVTLKWITSGSKTVTINYTEGGCPAASATSSTTTTVNPLPTPSFTAQPGAGPVCAGTNVTYTTQSGKSNYVWGGLGILNTDYTITSGGVGTSSNTVTLKWLTTTNKTVTINYTSGGCTAASSTSSTTTSVDPVSVAGTVGNAQTICNGATPLPISVTGYTGLIVRWEKSSFSNFSSPVSIAVTTPTLTLGVHTSDTWYRVIVQSGSCSEAISNEIKINVHTTLSSGISGGTSPVCYNSSPGTITATASGGDGTYFWAWKSSATGSTVLGTNNTYTPGNLTATTDFWCDITSSCGPITTSIRTITVHPQLTLSGVTQNAQVCSGSSATMDLTGLLPSIITYTVAYSINGVAQTPVAGVVATAGGTASFSTGPLPAVSNGKTLQITGITNQGTVCSASFTQNTILIVNSAPIPTISGDPVECVGSTLNNYSTEAGMTSYNWTVPTGGTITGGTGTNSISVTWNTIVGSPHTVTVNYTDANLCTPASPTVKNVTVADLPTPTLTGPSSACIGSTGNVYTTQAGMPTYSWAVSGGGTITSSPAGNFIVVTWHTSGPQSVSVNYTTASGCTAASPYNYPVTVNPATSISGQSTAAQSQCIGGTFSSISVTASGTGTLTYQWYSNTTSSNSGGAPIGSATSASYTPSASTAGTLYYYCVVHSDCGSDVTSAISGAFTVNSAPIPTISGDPVECVGSTLNNYSTEAGMTGYSWTVPTGGTITGGTGTNSISVTWNSVGSPNTVTVNYTNTNSCTAASPTVKNVTVEALPNPTITSGPSSVCIGSAGNVYTTQAGMPAYTWSVSGGGTITSGTSGNFIVVTWNASGPQSVSVNYSTTSGCTAAVPANYAVTVNPLPVPTFITGPSVARITSTGNLYSTQAGMPNYVWNVSGGGTITAGGTATSSSVTVTWNTAGPQTVSVSYTNTSNCTAAVPTVQNVTVNPLPSVSGVTIIGIPAIGNTLTGNSTYTDGGGGGNMSTFRWLRNGSTPVGLLNTYLVQPADLNSTLTFEVTPVSTVGPPNAGAVVTSSATLPVEDFSEIPVADQVCIEGVRAAGSILKGKYRYTHSKPEGASILNWYIDGVYTATGSTYTLQAGDIDNNEIITFEVTPVSSNIIPVSGTAVTSNELAKMPLWPVDYSVSGTSVPLPATPTGGIFSGPGVTNGNFSPSSVGIGGPYNIQYQLIIVNSATTCSQQVTKAVNVVTSTTEFANFKPVYCNDELPSVVTITGTPPGATSLGFSCTDGDAIVSSTAFTVTIDPRKMNQGTNVDYLYFSYRDILFNIYTISKPFVIDKVGTNIQILNLDPEYCADAPIAAITVTGATPAGGTALWTGTVLTDLTATSASVNVTLGTPGQTYPLSYQYTTPLGCRSAILTRSVTVNPLPNTAFTLNPYYNYDGPEVDLIPVQSPGTFSGDGVVSNNKLLPLQAGLGEHTINYYIKDTKGCDDSRNIKTTIKKAQGTITGIPAVICYQDITYNINVTGLPAGYSVNSFVNSRNSIVHTAGSTSASYNVPAAGEGLDTLTFSYKLDAVDYWISTIVNIDSLGLVDFTNLFPGDKICDNIAPFKLNATPTGGVFSGPVAGNFLDPVQTAGSYGVTYVYTNQKTACSISKTIPVEIIKAPVVSFAPKDVCIESLADITYFANKTKSSDKVVAWLWTFAEIGAAPDTVREPGFLYRTGGIHALSLRATTISGCIVTKDSSINLGLRPTGKFTWQNDCYSPGTNLKLFDATGSELEITSRTWNFNNGSLISSDLNPEYPMPDTGIVNVKYIVRTNYANCADTVVKNIYLRPTFKLAPDVYYSENFESGKNGWGKDESDIVTSWQFGIPNGKVINSAYSGAGAWFTRYDTLSPPVESSSVISPCFDFTDIQRPMISIEAIKRFEKNRNGAALQYFAEGDTEWKYVGTLDDGIEWYNSTLISGEPGGEKIGWTTLGDVGEKEYVQSSHALDELQGRKNVKFRIAYGSDGSNAVGEGIAFDDVRIGERSRKVLLEHFTNTGSKAGSDATKIVDEILTRRMNDVINIQYHTNFPDNDLFYTANQGDASARIFSYGLSRVPYTMIDGGNQLMYASLADYKTPLTDLDTNDLSRRSLLDTRFEIEVGGAEASGVLTVKSKITSTVSGSFDNLVLYLVVTEKKNSNTETGALGEKTFYNIFRKFIPDAGGIELGKNWTKGEAVVMPDQVWAIPGNLSQSEIEVIAFIQNSRTKEVYQVSSDLMTTAKSGISNSPDAAVEGSEDLTKETATSFGLYPNPADERLTIEFNNRLAADAEVRIFDLQGVIKATYKVASGESGLFIEDLSLKAGIYFVRVTSGGVDLGFKKLIVTGE